MKRKLSLLLAVVMILGSFSFAFAEDVNEAANFLEEKGVLVGDTTGDLMLGEALERRDSVVLLSRLMGVEEEAKSFEAEGLPTWEDNNDSYYNGFLAWAQANEYFKGHSDVKFGPRDNITAREYAVVLLRALEYVEEAEAWDEVYETAKELGLLEGVEKEADEEVTRGEMALMTYAALETALKDSEETLAEKLGIEMPQPEVLEVEEVLADNLKEIKVVFNKDVDMSVYDSDNYETNAGEIENAFIENGNVLVIRLEDAMTNKKEYKLTISRMEELNGEYKFTAYDNIVPQVEEVVTLGTKAVKVVMSEPVKEAKIGDFKLDGKTIYGTTELVGREIVVKPYKVMDVGEYELTVGRLEDYAGFKSVESKHPFEVIEDNEKPTVVDVQATLEYAVITFSEDIDNATVSRYNVYHGNKVYPEDAVKIAGNRIYVVFTADKALPVYETTLYVSGFADYSGNKMDAAEIKVKPSVDETRPEVIKAELQKDLKTIAVKFSKSVNKKDAEDLSNYTILDPKDNKLTISEVKVDGRVVEIVLGKALDENKEYTLKISGIRDNNKYANTMYPYEEKISVGDVSAPAVKYVSGKWDDEKYEKDEKIASLIHVYFNKDMDLGTLADPNNYLVKIDGANKLLSDVDGDVDIIKSDGTIVLLTVVNKHKVDDVGVLGVKDTTGKKLSNYGEMFEVKEEVLEFVNAVAEAKDTVELEFSLPISKAPRAAFSFDGDATVKEVEISGEYVTLKLDKKLPADASEALKIADEEVVAFNGDKLEEIVDIELTDEIAPKISKVEASYTAGDENVVLEVKFDENVKADNYGTAETDLVVKKIEGVSKVNFEIVNIEEDVITINVPVEENILSENATEDTEIATGFNVEVVKGARFILDESNNPASESEGRTDKVKGIVLPTVEEDPVEVDKDALEEAIAAAEELQAEDYTEESWAVLVEALEMPEETQEEVDAKLAAINEAIEALEEAEPVVEEKVVVEYTLNQFGLAVYALKLENVEAAQWTITITVEGETQVLPDGEYAPLDETITADEVDTLIVTLYDAEGNQVGEPIEVTPVQN